MNVAVVGTGNVGSALLIQLADVETIHQVLVMNLQAEWSKAAIMDVASARPHIALTRYRIASFNQLQEADLIVMTSGVQMKKGETGLDVLEENQKIYSAILDQSSLKKDVCIIGLATPVDKTTPFIQSRYGLPRNHVMGFGGDLDRNRLSYVLQQSGIASEIRGVIGEHGENTIPVYDGEEAFHEVSTRVRHFLADITSHGGSPRNLATGWLLAKLVDSIVNNKECVHCVCGYHPEYDTYTTWPFIVGREGVIEPQPLDLPPQAKHALAALLKQQLKGTD